MVDATAPVFFHFSFDYVFYFWSSVSWDEFVKDILYKVIDGLFNISLFPFNAWKCMLLLSGLSLTQEMLHFH